MAEPDRVCDMQDATGYIGVDREEQGVTGYTHGRLNEVEQ